MFRTAIAIAALAVASLTACDPSTTDVSPSASGTPTPSATSAASPTPDASVTTGPGPVVTPIAAGDCPEFSDDPDLAMAAIDFNYFAGICTGMAFSQAEAASGLAVSGEVPCPWYAVLVSDEGLGYYVSALSPPETPGSEIWSFRMQWLGDPADASAYEMPSTPEGITIGSTEAQLNAAYPGATTFLVDDYARGPRDERIVLGPDSLAYVFDITSGLVSEVTWGTRLTGGVQGEVCAL